MHYTLNIKVLLPSFYRVYPLSGGDKVCISGVQNQALVEFHV